jgi:bifunctional DNase/RNase
VGKPQLVEASVRGVVMDEKNKAPVVILQESGGTRRLPIWIGPTEATAIAFEMDGKRFQRPLTHDLMAAVLHGLKAVISRVEITELRENTFYARILIERGAEALSVDARPSDCIALALRMHAPIFVELRLFAAGAEGAPPDPEKSEEDQAEDLRRWIEDLDPSDFGNLQI